MSQPDGLARLEDVAATFRRPTSISAKERR
jgi:hypothetical protein